jgi:hypothetical protein
MIWDYTLTIQSGKSWIRQKPSQKDPAVNKMQNASAQTSSFHGVMRCGPNSMVFVISASFPKPSF